MTPGFHEMPTGEDIIYHKTILLGRTFCAFGSVWTFIARKSISTMVAADTPPEQAPAKAKPIGKSKETPSCELTADDDGVVRLDDTTEDLRNFTNLFDSDEAVSRVVVDLRFLPRYQATLFSILDDLEVKGSIQTFEIVHADFNKHSVAVAASVLLESASKNETICDISIDCRGYPRLKANNIPERLPKAIAKCAHMESCWLEHLDETLLQKTLLAIRKNKMLKNLSLVPCHYSVKTFESLGVLIRRSSSLEVLELHEIRLTAKRFEPVVSALKCGKAKELSLHHCRFTRASTDMLVQLNTNSASNNSRLETLSIGRDVRFSKPLPLILVSLLKNHQWKALDLKYCILGHGQFVPILSALEQQSQIERLALGNVESDKDIDQFVESIPKLQGICSVSLQVLEHSIERVLAAIQSNTDMQSCRINDQEILLKQPGTLEKMEDFKSNRVSEDDYQGMFAVDHTDRSEDNLSLGF